MNHDKLLRVVPAGAPLLWSFLLYLCVYSSACVFSFIATVSYCSQRSNFLSHSAAVIGKKLFALLIVAEMLKSAFEPSPANFPETVNKYPAFTPYWISGLCYLEQLPFLDTPLHLLAVSCCSTMFSSLASSKPNLNLQV